MKQRSMLSAADTKGLYDYLDRRLESAGIESQPEVVLRLLDLSTRKDAQLLDYAKVIKADHAISGRVLKLSNSALFAQRTPVTNLERACLLLGLERLKSISLGFHLSRAAAAGGVKAISRRVWGQSVFRACLAAESARVTAPGLVAEAFVVGLMMDAGIPLMCKLLGDAYTPVYESTESPARLYRHEFETLAYTHVDIVTVLCRKWKLPELLAKPLELHHSRPADHAKDEPVNRLHRLAFVVGSLQLEQAELAPASLMEAASDGGITTAQRLLRINDEDMTRLIRGAVAEYQVLIDVFAEVATGLSNTDDLAQRVQAGLINAIDQSIENSLSLEQSPASSKLIIRGQFVEIVRESDGAVVAFVSDSRGQRLVSHRINPATESAEAVCEALGLDAPSDEDSGRIADRLRALAA